MSTYQRLTLIGLYNYEQQFERDLFSSLTLPAGYDKPTFVNTLLLEHGEKCVMYTDPAFMRSAIGIWSGKWQLELSRIFEALTAEYNPIYNYDRYEESDDGRGKSYTSKVTGGATTSSQTDEGRAGESTSIADTSLNSSSAEESESKHKAKDTPKYDVTNEQITSANNEHQVSADNSSTYQPESKDILNAGKTKTNTDGATQDLDETTNVADNTSTSQSGNTNTTTANTENASTSTHGETTNTNNVEDSETETNSHRAHLFGNIGVTTSAAMVSEVVLQRMNKNLYGIATGLFANELLIGLW